MAISPFFLGPMIAATPLQSTVPLVQRAAVGEHPALWVVNDSNTIIYLFGTFHALDGKKLWFDQAVKTAFSESDELMLETVVPGPQKSSAPATGKGNPAPEAAHVVSNGNVIKLAPSASFLATTKLVMTAGRSKGMSTDRGADAILRDAADQAGIPVRGLESFEFQLDMFSTLPGGPAKTPPPTDLRTLQALADVLLHLQAAWNRGAVEETFAPLLLQMQTQSPQTYRTMFVERNARWANWISDRMETPGTIFVAVGAGHLAGPDSVQNQLSTLGVKSARIN
ncbi:MAG: TraB/GumN family protein [Sphingomicrobium sp.]